MLYIESRAAQSHHLSQLTARVCEMLLIQKTHHTTFSMAVQVKHKSHSSVFWFPTLNYPITQTVLRVQHSLQWFSSAAT
jgi:hypothetical protein